MPLQLLSGSLNYYVQPNRYEAGDEAYYDGSVRI